LYSIFAFGFDRSQGLLTSIDIYPIITYIKKNALDSIFNVLIAFLSYFCLHFIGSIAKVTPFCMGSIDFFVIQISMNCQS